MSASGLPVEELQAQTARLFGVDVWYDISTASASGFPGYVVTAAGDLKQATGHDSLRQSLLRRLLTNPGDWKTLPTFGVGARRYVKGRNTPAARTQLQSDIRSQFLQDKRVASVDTAVVTPLADGSDGLLVSVVVTPIGQLRGGGQLVVATEVR